MKSDGGDRRGETERLRKKAEANRARDAKKARELLALVKRRKLTIEEAFYDMGLALRQLLDEKLHVALDLPSFDAMLKAHRVMSAAQAHKLIAITRKVERETALQMGLEKAYAMVRHVAATPEPDTVAGLLEQDAPIGSTTATRASAVEVVRVTRALRAKAGSKPARTPAARAEAALAKKLRRAVGTLGLGRAQITIGKQRVTIELSRKAAERLPDA